MLAFEPLPPADQSLTEADHRIANNLSMLAAYARFEAAEVRVRPILTGAEGAQRLEQLAARVHAIARLHRLLTQSPEAASGPAYLADVCSYAADAVSAGRILFAARFDHGLSLPQQHLGALGMILVEGIINAAKYAHPAAGVTGVVVAGGRRKANGDIVLDVRDDGVGLPEGFCTQAGGGIGMRMMRDLAARISADLSFRSTPLGLTLSLRLRA